MTSARRQRDLVAPTMFPFLAVLLCTMGALVVILMLVVASAQASARQVVDERKFEVEAVESQVQLARDSYEKQLATGNLKLEKKRLALQHLENHIQELLGELKQLEATAALLEDESPAEELASSEQELSELERQLAAAQEELKTKLEKPDGDKPIFAIIPYDGPNGTHRRPIYLECTADGVTIQPEGISLTAEDLQPPYGPGNPLDAALRTIRTEFVPSNLAITSTAYPLLIVRPSGIQAYAAARAAMSGWDDQFGYELVDEELELVFPDSKPGLSRKIAQALDLARQRQAALVKAMPRKYRQFAGASQWSGEGSGGGYADEGYASGGSGSFDSAASGGTTSGESWQASRGGYAAGDAGGGSGQGTWMSDEPALGFGGGSQSTARGDASTASQDGSYFADSAANPGSGAQGDAQMNSADSSRAQAGGEAISQGSGQAGSGFQTVANSTGAHGSNSSNSGPSNSSNSSNSSSSSDSNSGSAGGSSGFGSQQMSAGGTQVAMPSFGQQSGGGSQAGQPNASGSSQAAGGAPNSGAQSSSAAGPPSLAVNRSMRETSNTRPVAAERGRGWAWSQGPPTQTPVVRSIRMMCENDRWIVLPDSSGRGTAETIDFEASPEQRAERLAKLIHNRVDSWGLAITGGYWKPILLVEVAEGAQWRFDQLERLFEGSGLEVQRRAPFK